MTYPPEVLERIDMLGDYSIDQELNEFHAIHLYPLELAYPTGYYDSRYFQLWGFNEKTGKKRDLGRHDGLSFFNLDNPVHFELVRIYADGSTLIVFEKAVQIGDTQAALIWTKP